MPSPRSTLVLQLVVLLAAGCGPGARRSLDLDVPPLVLQPIRQSNVADGRGRFREVLLAVRDARSGAEPDDPGGEAILHRMADEPAPTGAPVLLGPARTGLRVLVVPGLLGDMVSPWVMPYAHGLARLEEQGFRTGYLMVSGRASCAYNAERLREALTELELAPASACSSSRTRRARWTCSRRWCATRSSAPGSPRS